MGKKHVAGIDQLAKRLLPATTADIILGREEIVTREIETAIRVYFRDRDIVSAHLLASAASDILFAIREGNGIATSRHELEKLLKQVVTEGEIQEVNNFLKLPYNFFKHSSSDTKISISLQPEFVEATLCFVVIDFLKIFGHRTSVMVRFFAWTLARHPDWCINSGNVMRLTQKLGLHLLSYDDAVNFFANQLTIEERT